MKTLVNGHQIDWSTKIWELWESKVAPLITDEEMCSYANYFTAREYRNEYDRGSNKSGFTYTVQPGNRVCFVDGIERSER